LAGRSSAKPETNESHFLSCPSSPCFDATINLNRAVAQRRRVGGEDKR
jgi:hypothetical protein